MGKNKLKQKERFDYIIKKNLLSSGLSENAFVYSIIQKGGNPREYPLYYNKTAFDNFMKEMQTLYPQSYLKYAGNSNATQNKGGAGSELVEKPGRYGLTPPKMASVASSSRFCYLALRNGTDALVENKFITSKNVEFEKECRIFTTGTAPQLDAFITDSEFNIYIEAKCHEIFDSHKITLKNKYWEYFENDAVLCKALEGIKKDDEDFTLPLSLFGIEASSSCFDIKQLICHLLGIKEQEKGKKAKLIYLFFEPIAENDEDSGLVDYIFDKLSSEIKLIFESVIIKDFCSANNIELVAIKEKSRIMEPLTTNNMFKIY